MQLGSAIPYPSVFDGTFYRENIEELATRLRESWVFYVSLKDFKKEECLWKAIGTRMLLQLLQKEKADPVKLTINDIYTSWHAPRPTEVINLLATGHSERKTVVLVVDDLHNIAEALGEVRIFLAISSLKNLAHCGFTLVCGTSATSEPINRLRSGRLLLDLPWNPPKSPGKSRKKREH